MHGYHDIYLCATKYGSRIVTLDVYLELQWDLGRDINFLRQDFRLSGVLNEVPEVASNQRIYLNGVKEYQWTCYGAYCQILIEANYNFGVYFWFFSVLGSGSKMTCSTFWHTLRSKTKNDSSIFGLVNSNRMFER